MRRASTAIFNTAIKSLQEGSLSAAQAKDVVSALVNSIDLAVPDDVPSMVEVAMAPIVERRGGAVLEGLRR